MNARVVLEDLAIGYPSSRFPRRRRATTVASGISATARRGELTALIGPNGAGKSTLLRTLCGLQPPLAGRVLIDGAPVDDLGGRRLAKIIATVLTDRVDPGLLTVRELVSLGRTPHLPAGARPGRADRMAVEAAMAAVGVDDLADRQFTELSDGQRQRTMTARALAQDPSLFVLDEPTSFLDVPSRVELMDVLLGLARDRDLAIVLSTHELELALRMADRIWLLRADGTLVEGTPRQLADAGVINRTFDRGRMRFNPETLVFDHDGTAG